MSRLAQALSQSEFVVTSELIPPKGIDLEPLFMKADALHQVVTAFNLTESHTAKMSMDPVAVGHLLLDRGIEPIVQMTSRDKNRIAIQASMLGAAALGTPVSPGGRCSPCRLPASAPPRDAASCADAPGPGPAGVPGIWPRDRGGRRREAPLLGGGMAAALAVS